MGINAFDSQSHLHTLTITSETTYGSDSTTIVSGDSVRIQDGFGYDFGRDVADNMVTSQRRSRQGSTDGKKSGGASFTTPQYLPGGANPFETSLLWRSLGFSETIGGSSVTYAPAAVSATLPSLCIHHNEEQVANQKYVGAAANQVTIDFPEDAKPNFQWEILAQDEINSVRSTASGTVDGSGSPVGAITLTPAADIDSYQVGALVTIGTSTGHRVTAVNHAAATFNISPNVTTNEGASPAVIPYTVWSDSGLSGTEASLVSGSVTMDGTSICVRSAQVVITQGLEGIPCLFQETVDGFTSSKLNISGTLNLTGTAALMKRALRGLRSGPSNREFDIVFVVGDNVTSGANYYTMTIKAELQYPGRSLPDEGTAEVTVEFIAKDTSTGNDSLVIVSQSV